MTTILKEGWMVKEGSFIHNWKSRWFVLYPQSMAYFTEQNGKKKGTFLLPGGTVVNYDPTAKQQPTFAVRIPGAKRIYRICAADLESRDTWMNAIKKVIDDQGETSEIFVPPPDNDIRRPSRKVTQLEMPPIEVEKTAEIAENKEEKIESKEEDKPHIGLPPPVRRVPGRRPPSRPNKTIPIQLIIPPKNDTSTEKKVNDSYESQLVPQIEKQENTTLKDPLPLSVKSIPTADQVYRSTVPDTIIPPTDTDYFQQQDEPQQKVSKIMRGPQIGPIDIDSLQAVKLRKTVPKQEENTSKQNEPAKEDPTKPFGVVLKKKTQETSKEIQTHADKAQAPSQSNESTKPFGVVLKKKNDTENENGVKATNVSEPSQNAQESEAPNPFGVVLKKKVSDSKQTETNEATTATEEAKPKQVDIPPPAQVQQKESEPSNPFGVVLKKKVSDSKQTETNEAATATEEVKTKPADVPSPTQIQQKEAEAANPFGVVLKKKVPVSDIKQNKTNEATPVMEESKPKPAEVPPQAQPKEPETTNKFGVQLKKKTHVPDSQSTQEETKAKAPQQEPETSNPFGAVLKKKAPIQEQKSNEKKESTAPQEAPKGFGVVLKKKSPEQAEGAKESQPEVAQQKLKATKVPAPEPESPNPFGVTLKKKAAAEIEVSEVNEEEQKIETKQNQQQSTEATEGTNPFGVKLKKKQNSNNPPATSSEPDTKKTAANEDTKPNPFGVKLKSKAPGQNEAPTEQPKVAEQEATVSKPTKPASAKSEQKEETTSNSNPFAVKLRPSKDQNTTVEKEAIKPESKEQNQPKANESKTQDDAKPNPFGVKLKSKVAAEMKQEPIEQVHRQQEKPKEVATSQTTEDPKPNAFGVKLKPRNEARQTDSNGNQANKKAETVSKPEPKEDNKASTNKFAKLKPAQTNAQPQNDAIKSKEEKPTQKTNQKAPTETCETVSPFGVRLKKSVAEKPNLPPATVKEEAPNPFGVKLKKTNVE